MVGAGVVALVGAEGFAFHRAFETTNFAVILLVGDDAVEVGGGVGGCFGTPAVFAAAGGGVDCAKTPAVFAIALDIVCKPLANFGGGKLGCIGVRGADGRGPEL